jgi:hypothetical protein
VLQLFERCNHGEFLPAQTLGLPDITIRNEDLCSDLAEPSGCDVIAPQKMHGL